MNEPPSYDEMVSTGHVIQDEPCIHGCLCTYCLEKKLLKVMAENERLKELLDEQRPDRGSRSSLRFWDW